MQEKSLKVLLVEDDDNFSDVLESFLELNDYQVVVAKDGMQGLKEFRKQDFDICIFDVMMPKMDGFQLAKEVKAENSNVPIIFLTAKNMQGDVVKGLELGADDYMTKPFHSDELLLRMKAILKRADTESKKVKAEEYSIGHFQFNYPLRTLKYDDGQGNTSSDKLSPKEAELLQMFCSYVNEVLPRSKALKEIWNQDNYFTARSMDVFVTKLRKFISKDPNLEIVNIHGNGFRLVDKSSATYVE